MAFIFIMGDGEVMTSVAAPIEGKILKICDQVDQAIADIEAGKMIDAVSIEHTSKELCDVLHQLPSEQAKFYLSKLSALIKYLDSIAKQLEYQKEIVQNDINAHQDRGAAFSAYQTAAKLKE